MNVRDYVKLVYRKLNQPKCMIIKSIEGDIVTCYWFTDNNFYQEADFQRDEITKIDWNKEGDVASGMAHDLKSVELFR